MTTVKGVAMGKCKSKWRIRRILATVNTQWMKPLSTKLMAWNQVILNDSTKDDKYSNNTIICYKWRWAHWYTYTQTCAISDLPDLNSREIWMLQKGICALQTNHSHTHYTCIPWSHTHAGGEVLTMHTTYICTDNNIALFNRCLKLVPCTLFWN